MLAVGADAVVMVENTRGVDTSMIEVVRPAAKGENVIQIGEDMAKGDALLPRGSLLRPRISAASCPRHHQGSSLRESEGGPDSHRR